MNKHRFRRIAVFASTAALAGGVVAGCGSDTATNSNGSGAAQGQEPGAPTDMAANLAKELGLSEAKVAAALKDMMPQGGPPNGGQAPPNGATPPDASATPGATTTS